MMTVVIMSAFAGGIVHAPAYAASSKAQQWDNEGAALGGSSSGAATVTPPSPAVPPPAPPATEDETGGGWFGWFSSDDDTGESAGRITTDVLGVDVVTSAVTAQEPATETAQTPAPPVKMPEAATPSAHEPASQPAASPAPVSQAASASPPVRMIPAAIAQEQQALRDIEAAQAQAHAPAPMPVTASADRSMADASAEKGETPVARRLRDRGQPVAAQTESVAWSKAGVPAPPPSAPLPKPAPPPDLALLQQESLSAIAQDDTAPVGGSAAAQAAAARAPVPLRDAIRTALAVNPDVRRTAAARDMLEAALRDTQGQTRPQLSMFGNLSGSYDTSKEKSNRFDDSVFAKAGVRANWQLYTFGASAARVRAGEESVARGDLDLIDRRETTAFEVLAIYIEALRQREMLDIEKFRIAQHEDFLKMTEQAAKAEQVLGSQLLLARTGLDQKKQAYMNAERGVQEMFFALERMTDERLDMSQLSIPFTPLVVLPEEDEFVARSIDDAPEVKALQAAVAAQRNELSGARKDRLGSVSLNASAAGDRNLIESDGGTQASGDVALEYSVPLYTGGSMKARIDRAAGALVQAEADLQKTRMMLREQLRLAYFSIQQNEDILRAARNEEEAAMATLDAYRGEVAYGGRAFSDIIMQIDNVSSARARAVSARYAKMLAAYAVVRRQNGLLHYFNLKP